MELSELTTVFSENTSPIIISDFILDKIGEENGSRVSVATPLGQLLDTQVMLSKMNDHSITGVMKSMFPALSTTMKELYPHIPLNAYGDVFSTPTSLLFTFSVVINEIAPLMEAYDDNGSTYITLPKGVVITDTSTNSLYITNYDVLIVRSSSDEYHVSYVDGDTDTSSVVHVVTTDNDGVLRLNFDLTATQEIVNLIEDIPWTLGSVFNEAYPYTNDFSSVEIIAETDDGFTTLDISYGDFITNDSLRAYIIVNDITKTLSVLIPTTEDALDIIRLSISIRSTKGLVAYNYTNYKRPSDITIMIPDSPFGDITFEVGSYHQPTGGRNKLSFSEVKTRVLNNTLGIVADEIVSENQMIAYLKDEGLLLSKITNNIISDVYITVDDNITIPDDELLVRNKYNTPTLPMNLSFDELSTTPGVVIEGDTLVITPHATFIYDATSKITSPDNEVRKGSNYTQLDQYLTTDERYYTPYYYVLDLYQNRLRVTPYHLTNPVIDTIKYNYQSYVDEKLYIESIDISHTVNGYDIAIQTNEGISDDLKNNKASAYIVLDDESSSHISMENIVTVSDDYLSYTSSMLTNFIVNTNDELTITGVTKRGNTDTSYTIPLEVEVNIVFTQKTQSAYVDDGTMLLLANGKGSVIISKTSLDVVLGTKLTHVWTNHDIKSKKEEYEIHTEDKLARYDYTVFDTDGVVIDGQSCDISYTVLHEKDDIIKDEDGKSTYEYLKGDIVRDDNGNRVLITTTGTRYLFNMLAIDLTSVYASDDEAVIEHITNHTTNRSEVDMESFVNSISRLTDIHYTTKGQLGSIPITTGEDISTSISKQALQVTVYSKIAGVDVKAMQRNIRTAIIKQIRILFTQQIIDLTSVSDIVKEKFPKEVQGLQIQALKDINDDDVYVFSVSNTTDRFVLKSRIREVNNNLVVSEDIAINFIDISS